MKATKVGYFCQNSFQHKYTSARLEYISVHILSRKTYLIFTVCYATGLPVSSFWYSTRSYKLNHTVWNIFSLVPFIYYNATIALFAWIFSDLFSLGILDICICILMSFLNFGKFSAVVDFGIFLNLTFLFAFW